MRSGRSQDAAKAPALDCEIPASLLAALRNLAWRVSSSLRRWLNGLVPVAITKAPRQYVDQNANDAGNHEGKQYRTVEHACRDGYFLNMTL